MADLEKAIEIALNAHRGQVDKVGEKYIYHPLRVMAKMKDNNSRIVAILHDVVEDTIVTLEHLKMMGFGDDIIESVAMLTKPKHENYHVYIQRIIDYDRNFYAEYRHNSMAFLVKVADLNDNMDFTRSHDSLRSDKRRVEKYGKAKVMIDNYITEQFLKDRVK